MKTIIAAALVMFSVSTAASAFEMPNLDGVQQMMQQGKGKRSQRAQQQQGGEEGQGQQQSRQGGMQEQLKGLMNGDTSGLQGMMNSFGR